MGGNKLINGTRAPSVFSNFFEAPMVMQVEGEGMQEFRSVEQYYCLRKALFCKDSKAAQRIRNSRFSAQIKALGRKLRNFDSQTWYARYAWQVMEEAVIAKFSQNPKLLKILFCTRHCVLAEASPRDHRWGIGLDITDPAAQDVSKWKGQNWLGQILATTRDALWNNPEHKAILEEASRFMREVPDYLLRSLQVC